MMMINLISKMNCMSTIRIKIKKVMQKISLTIATKNDRTYGNIILRNWTITCQSGM